MYSNLKIPQGGTNLGTATYDRVLHETLKDTGLGKPRENKVDILKHAMNGM